MATKDQKTLIGPGGIAIYLDRNEVYEDDPGCGTPAIVELTLNRGTATYYCALNEGYVHGNRGDHALSERQSQWLQAKEEEVDTFLYD